MNRLGEMLVSAGIARREEIRPCSTGDVDGLEQAFGVALPKAYRSFLLAIGRGAGRFYLGTSIFYPDVLDLREYAEELLVESHVRFHLPSDAVVFGMHQGYSFTFFRTGEGDDPPIYRYIEDDSSPEKIADHFSGFIERAIEDHCRIK